jgi:hypothetical protein
VGWFCTLTDSLFQKPEAGLYDPKKIHCSTPTHCAAVTTDHVFCLPTIVTYHPCCHDLPVRPFLVLQLYDVYVSVAFTVQLEARSCTYGILNSHGSSLLHNKTTVGGFESLVKIRTCWPSSQRGPQLTPESSTKCFFHDTHGNSVEKYIHYGL